jgi:hypothetical protein
MNEFNLALKLIECSKNKCKKERNLVINDKNLQKNKTDLVKEKNLKKIEQLITKIYTNENQNNLDLCAYKKCNIHKKIYELKIKSFKDKIKVYDIKLPTEIQKKFDNLIELIAKPLLTNEEFLKSIILYYNILKFINNKITIINKPFIKLLNDYVSCGKKNCNIFYNEVEKDKDLIHKKIYISSIKDDEKRNKEIIDIFSNEKQVKLDKCITKKCNNVSLKLIQKMIKILDNKIKVFNLKIPENMKLSNIKKITEDDIPEIIIKLNQISKYVEKYVGNI